MKVDVNAGAGSVASGIGVISLASESNSSCEARISFSLHRKSYSHSQDLLRRFRSRRFPHRHLHQPSLKKEIFSLRRTERATTAYHFWSIRLYSFQTARFFHPQA